MLTRQVAVSLQQSIPVETHLQRLRLAELESVRDLLPPCSRILELGGGNGHQAAVLSTWGHCVSSVDIAPPSSGQATFFPVLLYDGKTLPYDDAAFDVVFSSNVLEHVTNLSVTLREIARVTKSNGTIVHILPTSAWRFWTSLTHYIHLARRMGRRVFFPDVKASEFSSEASSPNIDWRMLLKRIVLDGPHGAYPNEFYELYAFRRSRWQHVFAAHGFEVTNNFRSGLFYTGYEICPQLSMNKRRGLSRFFGSATWIYVMRPAALIAFPS